MDEKEKEDDGKQEASSESEESRLCRSLLHKKIRVGLNDGRLVIGTFQCIDSRGNILIGNALEVRRRAADDEYGDDIMPGAKGVAPGEWMERYVGLVVVSKHQRKSVKVKATKQEFMDLHANAKKVSLEAGAGDESSANVASSSLIDMSTTSIL